MDTVIYCRSMFERDEAIARLNSKGMIPQSCYIRLGEKSIWIVAGDNNMPAQELSEKLIAKKKQLIHDKLLLDGLEAGTWDAIKDTPCSELEAADKRLKEALG